VVQFYNYVGRFQSARTGFGGLPLFARFILLLAALPGIALAVLSILALLVSILLLCLLVLPAYRLLRLVCFTRENQGETVEIVDPAAPSGRRQIDVKIVE